MKRLLWVGFAACVPALTPALPASAMSVPRQSAAIANINSDITQIRGHHGGRGHHYGWGRGHHYGWGHHHHHYD
jgi:hypothetical protein